MIGEKQTGSHKKYTGALAASFGVGWLLACFCLTAPGDDPLARFSIAVGSAVLVGCIWGLAIRIAEGRAS